MLRRKKIGWRGMRSGFHGPAEAFIEVPKVMTELTMPPPGVSVVCEKAHEAAIGRLEQLKLTGDVNPADDVSEIVKLAL